ncbi:alpha/beta hydrolase family protein [Chitinophaga rhizophila]|uniref:Alpha/beta fold hydrolase n=1 Tax=Chitinophaga rhizophila TaxID=2866212 RepID=A0ABS7GBI2_9BACT|nr:alpha/beta fold hydrolase [Chitinophaga rhizophila]MBW8684485.1 alpha/beta fold hydrolase [Chitinophaga rhizophila]
MEKETIIESGLKVAAIAGEGTAVISVSPVILSAPERGTDIEVRISAPITGDQLPIIVFAHGYGSSLDGYAPLVNYWAAHGFVVVQPTFLDSRTLALGQDDPRTPLIWKYRVSDMKRILDDLNIIIEAIPGLSERVDKTRIAAAGHSFGAQTTGMLLGARILDADGNPGEDLSDARIKAGILLCAAGRGGEDLSPFAAANYPFMNPGYSYMTTPTLIVAGDQDHSPLTVRGPEWFYDAYLLSPGDKWLLTLFGGEHLLGGISGYLVTETSDENPERVAAVQALTWAYLRSALYAGDKTWETACNAFMDVQQPIGSIKGKAQENA